MGGSPTETPARGCPGPGALALTGAAPSQLRRRTRPSGTSRQPRPSRPASRSSPGQMKPKTSSSSSGMVSPAGTAGGQAATTAGAPRTGERGGRLVWRLTRNLAAHPGFGIPSITATRILNGQLQGKLGPETPLALDSFPYTALSKVSPLGAEHGATVTSTGLLAQQHPGVQEHSMGCQRALHVLCRRTAWTGRFPTAQPRPQPTCAG